MAVTVSLVRPAFAARQQADVRHSRSAVPAYLAVLGCYLLGALAVTARLWRDPASLAQAGDIRDVDQFKIGRAHV